MMMIDFLFIEKATNCDQHPTLALLHHYLQAIERGWTGLFVRGKSGLSPLPL